MRIFNSFNTFLEYKYVYYMYNNVSLLTSFMFCKNIYFLNISLYVFEYWVLIEYLEYFFNTQSLILIII